MSKPALSTAEVDRKWISSTSTRIRYRFQIQISDSGVPYLTSKPILDEKKLKKVVILVVSKDQGSSPHQPDHGMYNNSWTRFELSVGLLCGEVGWVRW